MKGCEGWKATSWMASSCFFLCAVISCTHVRLSSIHKRTEQSWPEKTENSKYCCRDFHISVRMWSVDVDVLRRLQLACCFALWRHTLCVHVYLLTAGDEVSAFRVCGKTGYSIQVSHHGMNHFPFGQSERKEERLGHVGYFWHNIVLNGPIFQVLAQPIG